MTCRLLCRRLGALVPLALFLMSCAGESGVAADVGPETVVVSDVAAPVADVPAPEAGGSLAPPHVARLPEAPPFEVTRAPGEGEPPSPDEVSDFTARMVAFYADTDYLRWLRRLSHGLAEDNPWGEPSYLYWWQDFDLVAERRGELVTFHHVAASDNMLAHMGRLVGPVVAAYLSLSGEADQQVLRELVLGYLRGISAMFEGGIWPEEDPVVPTIMARAIFHRNHEWTLDGGRRAAVNYEPQREEVVERRHDTVHNPANPTWGDIYVRNKRSKDDFPWLFRAQLHLARLLADSADEEIRGAALKLYDQLEAFAADIFDHGYLIRAKGAGGEIYIPYVEGTEVVDDFASLVSFEAVVPNAECNAKLPVALLATGEAQGNDCEDGISELYEETALLRYYGHTWMQWGFHVTALTTALLYGDPQARALLEGLGARMDELAVRDDKISADPRYRSDVAQLLVLAAAYGLPLKPAEARLVMDEYARAAAHYAAFPLWDLWAPALADGDYDPFPVRESDDGAGGQRTHIWIPEMANLFEYCASPLRARDGAGFIDCDLLADSAAWPRPAK